MKKLLIPFTILLLLLISACGNTEQGESKEGEPKEDKKSGTFTYESETGPVEVPADPKRVVLLSGFTGNVMQLGVNIVGVDTWSKNNPRFEEELKDAEEVSEDNLEKIIELEPDLIIALSTVKNYDKLKEIAPTVTYTWGKLDYLSQHEEIGKLLNKEEEAKKWVADFKQRAETAGEDIRAKIGEDATVSVFEIFDKQLYVFGDNWARGTEILYQAMDLKMPEKVKEMALKDGYYAISTEVLPEYSGDYIILSKYSDADHSFQETDTYKNIPAVKNNRVFEMEGNGASFSDPITLDAQLEFFKESFLGK
ncbi:MULTISPECIES: iron-hydroxamate ABC transporter substrate-binding protein [Cytobacillus]|jgi:iron complex transport system substrate-binding protein|uniref:ABC transporter substrate-binding protein n=1 Tax=Cytobacillus oceanisediminis 2691 TaxID=1196031 RepID=A0A160M6F5_9BACI|nr:MULTISPECIES: iron-hydroxamate ABC transporter substrate-binding protein [Cytobacillus]AND38026.1 ABC transporter substrate-binding protein [Cytobacillus oceanisediminis 2691]MBU8733384.1 iron-hydroxamate ABC transporter substrate-binding protein [Cytobacillus oceanisediminis]MBY0158076.1 ABC transporter substrate-binding protein [Cytobacillus firmus]MCM3245530.1 iron-hydroxamate ABC transporter substrate-binding protein [Cytobacillus oceanisediminis]MCM3394698.1 iron-hydroxamate ABC transp